MRHWKRTLRTLLAALAVCLLCFTPARAKKPDNPGGGGGGDGGKDLSYEITVLDDVDGLFVDGWGRDVNEPGHVVGQVTSPLVGDMLAAYWSVIETGGSLKTTLHLLALDQDHEGAATSINDRGEIVGARVYCRPRFPAPWRWRVHASTP